MSGRPSQPVIQRISEKLSIHTDLTPYEGHPELVPAEIRDNHWIWEGFIEPPRRKATSVRGRYLITDSFVMPARIRLDGAMVSVARILHKLILGRELPPSFRRANEGCDYRCVNPFHLSYSEDQQSLPQPPEEEDHESIIQGLVADVGDYIAAHGRGNDDAIYDHFGLDYSEAEIAEALRSF